MADPKGDKLYVNLSAAETRRRLKGFGHGVRKVHSGGRRRAVVIHTATGRNLESLRAKFADVGCSTRERELGEPLEDLRNLGPISAGWLREAGIQHLEQLRGLGPVVAYQRVRQKRPEISRNLLWALAAGLLDKDWRELSESERSMLERELDG